MNDPVLPAPTLRGSVPPEAASRHFDPVLRPDLGTLYLARAERLAGLAAGHELEAYLTLASHVARAQAELAAGAVAAPLSGLPDPLLIARSSAWPQRLDQMIAALRADAPESVAAHLEALATLPEAARRTAAVALLEGRFDAVDPALAPFLWAALSFEVASTARLGPLPPKSEEEPVDCPVCGCAPVASLIHSGDRQGLRYLHCALCECEWHMVRAKCSSCGDSAALDYLSFDTPEAAVRAEACSACGGYLKVISAERAPEVEVVADDLATLVLDDAAGAEGFGRSGFNPFALPGQG